MKLVYEGLKHEMTLGTVVLQTSLANWPVRHLSLDPVDARRAAFVLSNGWAGGLFDLGFANSSA